MSANLDKMRQAAAASKAKKEEFIPGIIPDSEMERTGGPQHNSVRPRPERRNPMTVTQKEQLENPTLLSIPGLDDVPAPQETAHPQRVAAKIPDNPKDPNIHESIEKDILEGPDSQWANYIARRQKEAAEYINEKFVKKEEQPEPETGKEGPVSEEDYDPEVEELEKSYNVEEATQQKPKKIISPADRNGIGNTEWDKAHANDPEPTEENFTGMDLTRPESEDDDAEWELDKESLNSDELGVDDGGDSLLVNDAAEEEEDTGYLDNPEDDEEETPHVTTFEVDVKDNAKSEDDLNLEDYSDEDDEEESDEEDERRLQDLKNQITKCITPVAMKRNISHFTVVKKCTTGNPVVNNTVKSAAKWVLPNSAEIIEMSEFDGAEVDYLRDNQGGDTTEIRNRLRKLYDHIVSPKPASFESWLKSIAYTDYDHLFFTAYIASFAGSNYIPFTCEKGTVKGKKVGCGKMFLSENMDVMQLVKFKNKKAKAAFNELYNSNRVNNKGLFVSEIMPISENYAVELKVPSIYSVLFETSSYNQKFRQDYARTIQFIPYVENFYQIDAVNEQLIPIGYQVFANNQGKTAKSRVICYSKIINSLTTDEYSNLFAIVNAIDDRADWFEYQRPEVECPECGRKIEAEPMTASGLLFTRHRLAVLANTSIK